jgi:hypothetical protein
MDSMGSIARQSHKASARAGFGTSEPFRGTNLVVCWPVTWRLKVGAGALEESPRSTFGCAQIIGII